MIVRELIGLLEQADPESLVLFLDDYADLSGTDEVYDVIIPEQPWIQERGYAYGAHYVARYPSELKDEGGDEEVVREALRVVLVTNGPTNHRRLNFPEKKRD